MEFNLKEIEDMSLNAWPSHQMELYDGWILRFSYFYTHRTNSVEQFGDSSLPWNIKIPYCEKRYQKWNTPTIFKISPLVSSNFDYMLENRGYTVQHTTNVMVLDLENQSINDDYPDVSVSDDIPPIWIDSLFKLKETKNIMHLKVVPSMYAAIPKDTICVSIKKNNVIVGTGLGVLDRNYIGIYAIHVHDDYRHQGYARQICNALLIEGQKRGAKYSYLQVVSKNEPAKHLYSSLGFEFAYQYWFRVKK